LSRFRLIPREEKFFADFMAMADQIKVGARLLEELLSSEPPLMQRAEDIQEVEHKCDFLTHEIIQRLNKTFVTPIDREDIHSMARALDDVMDDINESATLFPLYRIDSVRPGVRELSKSISAQADAIRMAMEALEKRKVVLQYVVEISRLESEADRIYRQAIVKLFDEERDPIIVMKWKEILDAMERATDRADDVANLVENIVVKHG
jgi:uncharacterized protein